MPKQKRTPKTGAPLTPQRVKKVARKGLDADGVPVIRTDMVDENLRTCIVTRESLPKDALIRFVLSPDGIVTPDLACKLPGRGLWVKCDMASVAQAAVKNAFSRAAKTQATVPAGLAANVEQLLKQRVLDALSMARKSGLLVAGYEKILKTLMKEHVVALIHATEAAEDGSKSLNAKADGAQIITIFSRQELGKVSARDNATHLALVDGHATHFFLLNYRRFTGFS